MGRKSGPPKERRHIHLNEGDWDWLIETYGPKGLTPSAVVATLLSKFRRAVEEKIARRLDSIPSNSVEIEELEIDLNVDDLAATPE